MLTNVNSLEAVESMMQDVLPRDRAGTMAREHLDTGGTRRRARLVLEAGEALGCDGDSLIAWAAAIELLHNATLVHDDIQDGDTTRRGQLATWVRYGINQAINVGDLLMMSPFLALAQMNCSATIKCRLSQSLPQRSLQIVSGQVFDIEQRGVANTPWRSYQHAAARKTGSLLALAIEGVALISGLDQLEAEDIGDTFLPLGILFQIQDDVRDLFISKGKQRPGSDLHEGKTSALVIAHLERCPKDALWLQNLLQRSRCETSELEIETAIDCFRSSGALDDVLDHIKRISTAHQQTLASLKVPALITIADAFVNAALEPIDHLMHP
jgi:geranylgeranyl diphosphate synthase, type I